MHMKSTTAYQKLSKKKQREQNLLRRKTWGEISPVTRRPDDPKAYNRKKAQRWKDDSYVGPDLLYAGSIGA